MRGIPLFAGIAFTFLTSSLFAQNEAVPEAVSTPISPAPLAQVSIDLTEVALVPDVKDKLRSGATKAIEKQLDDWQRQNMAKVIDHFQVTALHAAKSALQVGKRVAVTSGRVAQRNAGFAKSYTYQEVGTIFSCTPLVEGDYVLLDFVYEKSELVSSDEEDTPPSIVTTRANSTVRIPQNGSIVIGGQRTGPDGKTIDWKLIIAAQVTFD